MYLEQKRYNELAFILSNENDITCRVSIFSGKRKSDKQYALNDFGKKCILISIDQIVNYIESFNITKLDETNRILERNDIHLFDSDCLREALLNAFIHNDWTDLNSPMILFLKIELKYYLMVDYLINKRRWGSWQGKVNLDAMN